MEATLEAFRANLPTVEQSVKHQLTQQITGNTEEAVRRVLELRGVR